MTHQLSVPTLFALAAITTEGRIAYRGLESIASVRRTIHELVRVSGYEIVSDPSSAPDLLDTLGITALGIAEGVTLGAGIGLLLGLLLDAPVQGLVAGALVGATAGGYRGATAVKSGLRLRALWIEPGVPEIVVEVR